MITPLPSPPNKSQPEVEFVQKADAWVAALDIFVIEANALSTDINQDKLDAEASRDEAALSEVNAKNSENAAAASANFKGLWGDLTGSLNTPATVMHNRSFWMLLEYVADVTAHEPGVSNKWASTSGLATLKTSNFLAQPGGDYILAPGVTMTLPASPTIGQRVTFRAAGDIESIMADMPMVARNGNEIQGIDEDVQINGQGSVTLIWAGVVQGGWI